MIFKCRSKSHDQSCDCNICHIPFLIAVAEVADKLLTDYRNNVIDHEDFRVLSLALADLKREGKDERQSN